MKKHSKVGNRKGKPAYRTPSRFIANKSLEVKKTKTWHFASRLDRRRGRDK